MVCLPTYALYFDGNDLTYVRLPDNLMPSSSSGSVAMWIKTTQATTGVLHGISDFLPDAVPANFAPRIYILNGVLRAAWAWPGQSYIMNSNTVVNDGRWHYVVLTAGMTTTSCSANSVYGTQALYIDGQLKATNTACIQVRPAMPYNTLGVGFTSTWGGSGWSYFQGFIANITFYNKPLSPSEIQQNMLNPLSPVRDGLIAWYPMLEGFGSVLHDYSGNSNHAQIYQAKWAWVGLDTCVPR